MICPKCRAEQRGSVERCSQCHKNLLPGRGFKTRIAYLALAMGAGAVLLGVPYLTEGHIPFIGLLLLFPSMLAGFIGGLVKAFGTTPLPERYLSRAKRFAASDPEQALVDFASALERGKAKNRPAFCREVLHERAQLYKRLGRKEDAVNDLEAYLESLRATGGAVASARIALIEGEIEVLKRDAAT